MRNIQFWKLNIDWSQIRSIDVSCISYKTCLCVYVLSVLVDVLAGKRFTFVSRSLNSLGEEFSLDRANARFSVSEENSASAIRLPYKTTTSLAQFNSWQKFLSGKARKIEWAISVWSNLIKWFRLIYPKLN